MTISVAWKNERLLKNIKWATQYVFLSCRNTQTLIACCYYTFVQHTHCTDHYSMKKKPLYPFVTKTAKAKAHIILHTKTKEKKTIQMCHKPTAKQSRAKVSTFMLQSVSHTVAEITTAAQYIKLTFLGCVRHVRLCITPVYQTVSRGSTNVLDH